MGQIMLIYLLIIILLGVTSGKHDKDDRKGKNSSSSIFHSTFNVTSVLYGRRSSQMTTLRMTSTENKIYQANEKHKHLTKKETGDNKERKENKQKGKSSNASTTTTTISSTLSRTQYTNSTITSNINMTTFHSNPKMGKNRTSHTEKKNISTTTPYSITLNVTENYTIVSEPSTTVVELMTVNSSTSSSSEPNNTHDSETISTSTQSHNKTDFVISSTTKIDPSGLSTLRTMEKGIDRSTSDELSTQQSGQTNNTLDTTNQFTNTTMSRESREENIPNPFTSHIDVLTVTAASASIVIVVISLIICIILRKRKQTECQSGDVKRYGDYELAMEVTSNQTLKDWTDFRSYETPRDLDSSEYHIPSEVNNTYQTLDFTVRSHVAPKFAAENNYSIANIANINQQGDHFTKGKNAMFELKGIVDRSDRNLQKTPLFYQSPSTKTVPSEETVAYCDTAIFHQEYLYDVPKHSIIDGVINPKNYFTGNQNAVAIIPSKETNQFKSTRIFKDKKENTMDSFKDKLNMSLSKKQFRQPNAYPVNPFPPSDTEIYSFAK